MDFEFSAEQEELRDAVRRFLADHAPISYVRSMLDDERGTTEEVWKGLAALGVSGMLVPEEHGGVGAGMVDAGVVLEEMGRAVHPGPFLSSAVGAVSIVRAAATPEEQAELLPGLADGTVVGTVALLEPARRFEWRDPATTARPAGAGWELSGVKTAVPDGLAADMLLVVSATAADGLGVFLVAGNAPGVSRAEEPTVDGTRKRARLELSGSPARRIGAGDATDAVAAAVDRLVVAMVVDGVGAASRVLEMALDYAKERVQFGRPIGSFQAVQHLCADMLQRLELARAGAYYALWACDAADPGERHRAATMAKAYASDALYEVGASAIQVHGGIGFTWEHDVHLFYKRLLTLQHFLGGTTDHLEELARLVLD